MPIDGVRFDDIAEHHLLTLLENKVAEGQLLEYKRDTYGPRDADKVEFLADVSSLANSSGGHLLIGMDESEGLPRALIGVDLSIDADAETLRLESLALDGLQPRVPGLRIRPIRLASGAAAILVRVPPSMIRPHCVVLQKRNRYLLRGSAGKFEPDVNQLRELFRMNDTTIEQMRSFHLGRVEQLYLNGHFPIKMSRSASYLLLHIFPYSSLMPGAKKVVVDEVFPLHDKFRPYHVMGLSWKVNLRGPIIYSNGSNGVDAYTQVYRSGICEMLRPGVVTSVESAAGPIDVIFSSSVEIGVTQTAFDQISALEMLGFSAPFVLICSLLGIVTAQVDLNNFRDRIDPIGEDVLTFDDVSIEASPGSAKELAKQLKPIFDQLANAGNRPKSVNFHPDGEWKLGTPAHG